MRVNILQGSATGNAVYSESHVTSSNANGLITVNIGGGSVLHGSFEGIDWSDVPYFLKTDIDPNGGNDYTITSVQQLLSVPYALYAKEAANSFSGDYNDLTNVPAIPTVPTNVSAFTNDAGYITAGQVPAQVNADWNATSGAAEILNKPAIPTVPTNVSAFTNDAGYITSYTETDPQFTAWDKDYNDLINKPAIPAVPTNVSAFTNDAGYITSAAIPAIPTVPTNVSAFTNDAGYITAAQVPAQVNADWNATSGAAQILNKPALFSGNYNDLTNKPVLFSGNYNSLTNRPNLAAVATSGNYNDLINKPTIPTAVGELTNNVGYITQAQVPAQVNADWNATSGAAQILNKPTLFSGNYNDLTNKPVLFSGDYNDLTNLPQIPQIPADISAFNNDAGYLTSYTETDPQFNAWDKNYNDLTNKPTIPTVPANVSAFTNDAGYVTANDIPAYQVLSISNDTIYLSNGCYAVLPPGFDGDYNSLTNRPNLFSGSYNDLTDTPAIPTVPTNVSAFTNDAGYLTEYTEQQVLSISNDTIFLTGGSIVKLPAGFSGDYNDLTNLPQIPQIPADISAFTNDAGYITGYTETDPQFNVWDKDYNDLINKPAIPAVPTNVSAFTNDAGYITAANVQEAANIPTNVSAFNNDAGYITSADIPEIPTMPTNVSAFNNDAGYITSADIPEIPTVPTNVSAFTNDAHYITDVQLQQIMNTIASMQNTIDSMGLVMEVLYNQINQSDSIPAGIDTGLQVTFTTTGYTNEPAVHQSDLSGTNFIHNYATTNGLTGNVNDWWIFESDRRSPSQYSTYIYINKTITSFSILRWNGGVWQPVDSQLSKFTLDQSTNTISFRYYNESDESWEVETSLYAIKFND